MRWIGTSLLRKVSEGASGSGMLLRRRAYESSIQENRARLRKIIGLVDERVPAVMERFGTEEQPALVAETDRYTIHQVRWPVLDGVTAEGLLLTPKSAPRGYVVALPDADQTPEQLTGLTPGVAAESQFARRLVENGLVVVVPLLIDRSTTGSGYAHIALTNQPHREWLHRQAYMMGRHIIGGPGTSTSGESAARAGEPGTARSSVSALGTRTRGAGAPACPPAQIKTYPELDEAGEGVMSMAITQLRLNARAYDCILKSPAPFEALAAAEHISAEHVAEAIQYRAPIRNPSS